MLITYLMFSGLTFSVVLQAFLKDHLASKQDTAAWCFIIVASAIWPLTLPCIIRSKLRAAKLQPTLPSAQPFQITQAHATQAQEG
ncbi:MAG: hypothetical protein AAGN15_17655 [Cyanobacteria bacterium J06581_3]